MARIDTKRNPKLRQELRVGCSLFASIVRLLGLGSQGVRGMGRRPGLGLTFYFLSYDLHWGCDGRHTEVDSPTDQGGGKRRPAFLKMPPEPGPAHPVRRRER